MKKIESIFITVSLLAVVVITGGAIWNYTKSQSNQDTYSFPETKYASFLAAQHAVYVNDFDSAKKFTQNLGDVQYPVVQNTVYLADFLSGRMPFDAHLLKNEKSMPARLIYDAHLIKNNKWKDFHNRHKTDESALAAPLRIWSAIANDWRTKEKRSHA